MSDEMNVLTGLLARQSREWDAKWTGPECSQKSRANKNCESANLADCSDARDEECGVWPGRNILQTVRGSAVQKSG